MLKRAFFKSGVLKKETIIIVVPKNLGVLFLTDIAVYIILNQI